MKSNRVKLKVCVTAGPHEGGTIEAPDGHVIQPGEKYTLCFDHAHSRSTLSSRMTATRSVM
jgi:hypothetical protein